MKENTNPLGTADIRRLVLNFSIPAIVSFLMNSLYNLVDQVFIGWGIGTSGMAATNVSFPLTTVCTALTLLFGTGGAAVFNLSLGRKNYQFAAKAAANAFAMLATTGILLGVITIAFLEQLLYAFGAIDAIMPYAKPYTLIVAFGFPLQVFAAGAGLIIRADGAPKIAMLSVLAGGIFNLIFDPIFLFVFHMGIEGIAVATVGGQLLSFAIVLWYLLRRFHSVKLSKSDFIPDSKAIAKIAAVGAAASINQVAMMAVQITMNNGVKKYGAMAEYGSEIPLAAVGAITKVQVLFLSIILGISQGCQPIISFNYGAKNYDRVRKAFRTALSAVLAASVFTWLCYHIFPRQIMLLFGSNGELYLDFATRYLKIYFLMAFVSGLQPFATYFFTSIGKSWKGTLLTIVRQIVLLVPLLLLLPMAMGISGLMYAGPISDAGAALLATTMMLHELRSIKPSISPD